MTNEIICRTKPAPRSALSLLITAWRSRRSKQATRRALETLSDEQLNDIGLRRLPGDPPGYERLGF